jgi:hypothetical protein
VAWRSPPTLRSECRKGGLGISSSGPHCRVSQEPALPLSGRPPVGHQAWRERPTRAAGQRVWAESVRLTCRLPPHTPSRSVQTPPGSPIGLAPDLAASRTSNRALATAKSCIGFVDRACGLTTDAVCAILSSQSNTSYGQGAPTLGSPGHKGGSRSESGAVPQL